MKFLVVGLGSMGKRRVRNLQALQYKDIAGFDARPDRALDAAKTYGINTFPSFEAALSEHNPDAVVISVPPDRHMQFAWPCVAAGKSCFIEASVVDAEKLLELEKKIPKGCIVAPSCTMRYFPGPKAVSSLIRDGVIGKPLSVTYHVGQYLPDWHPWEQIEDFYVSKRETGGCREIVPFELTWLNHLFGTPKAQACAKAKVSSLNADIDDVYHCLLEYPGGLLMNLTIDVLSRPVATREMRIVGSAGLILFSGESNSVRWRNIESSDWQRMDLSQGTVEKSYIYPEEPYIDEMRDFIAAVMNKDSRRFPNTLSEDYAVLQTLYALESVSKR